jgi:hypothetical protein
MIRERHCWSAVRVGLGAAAAAATTGFGLAAATMGLGVAAVTTGLALAAGLAAVTGFATGFAATTTTG